MLSTFFFSPSFPFFALPLCVVKRNQERQGGMDTFFFPKLPLEWFSSWRKSYNSPPPFLKQPRVCLHFIWSHVFAQMPVSVSENQQWEPAEGEREQNTKSWFFYKFYLKPESEHASICWAPGEICKSNRFARWGCLVRVCVCACLKMAWSAVVGANCPWFANWF